MKTRYFAFTLLACCLAMQTGRATAQVQEAQQDVHDACLARADQCDSDCMQSAASFLGSAIGTLLSHNKGNLPALQDSSNSTSQSCNQCAEMRDGCD